MPEGRRASGVDSPRAWLTVAATFAASAVTLGTVYSFGAFFESMAEEFGTGKGETSVVFGLTTFGFFWLSLATGRMADRHGPRPVLAVGAVAMGVGLWATAGVGSIGVGYLTFGLGAGVSGACAYIPMVGAVGGWFERRRAAAIGVAVSGIGIGTLVMSPLSARLIEAYGWRTTYRVFAVGGAVVLGLCVLAMARPPGTAGARPRPVRRVLASSFFRRMLLAAQFSGFALFLPFVFMVSYAQERGVSSVAAAGLVGLLGGSSVVSRLAFSTLSGRFGAFRLYRFGVALFPVSYAVWLVAGSSFALMVAFVLVLGMGYGIFVAVSPLVLADRFGPIGLGTVMGVLYTTQGLGALVGPLSAGRLIDATGSYTVPLAGALVMGCVSFAVLASVRTDAAGRPLDD